MLDLINLYSDATPSYSGGAKDTGHGFGLPKVSPLFADWASAADDPPNGIGSDINNAIHKAFVYDGKLYLWIRSEDGDGPGIFRYTLNLSNDPITMAFTTGDYVDMSDIGLPAWFDEGRFQYADHETGDVLIAAFENAAKTITCGRWNVASHWPFTTANAVWRGVPSSYGAVVADQVPWYPAPYVDPNNDRVYVMGQSGKCLVFKWSDGTYLDEFEWQVQYKNSYRGILLGVWPSDNDLLFGFQAGASDGKIHRWDPSTPGSWSQGNLVFDKSGSGNTLGSALPYGPKVPHKLNSYYWWTRGLSRADLDLLGCNSTTVGWLGFEPTYSGPSFGMGVLCFYNTNTQQYWERKLGRICSYSRTGLSIRNSVGGYFAKIDGQPWMIAKTEAGIDHFAEESYTPQAAGLMAVHIGKGQIDLAWTATAPQSPKKLLLEIDKTSIDSEFSADYGKWQAALKINDGGFSDFRAGPIELMNLDSTINGKTAWSGWSKNDIITLRLQCSSGVLHQFAPVQGNPGDRTTPDLPTANIGPPRDVLPKLAVETTADAYKVYGGELEMVKL